MNGTIAVINTGTISDECVAWLWAQPRSLHLVRPRAVSTRDGGIKTREIAAQRNAAVEEMRGDFILFVDSDNVPPADALPRMLAHRWPLVSGVILERRPPFSVCAVAGDGPWRRVFLSDLPETGGLPVFTCGTGCLLVKRSVFDRLLRPYFRVGQYDMEHLTEDTDFTTRARLSGIAPLLACDVRVGHVFSMLSYADDESYWLHFDGVDYRERAEAYA